MKQLKKNSLWWAGGLTQAIELLPSKRKALSSNPSTPRKKIYLGPEKFKKPS
jgi:hypothetical protein